MVTTFATVKVLCRHDGMAWWSWMLRRRIESLHTIGWKATVGFNATPAFSDNQIFLRSNTCLYCVSKEVD